jgi:hypothetical protein
MSLDLDVVINSPEYSIDMKAGLTTLQGASDATRIISETILTEKIPGKKTYKGKVRTTLKNSFDGSFGQIFSINIYDEVLKERFNKIGREAFSQLIAYYLNDAVYKDMTQLSEMAQKVIRELGDKSDDLTKELRLSSIKHIHDASIKFNYDTKIRVRFTRDDQKTLVNFDRVTAKTLLATVDKEARDLIASITRLNINTGNGRLQIEGEKETTAFGFGVEYKTIKLTAKKIFSENLDHNNGLEPESWKHLRISAKPVTLQDGKIIKYIVVGIYEA